MKYRPPRELKRGRLFASIQLTSLNLPRLTLWTEGDRPDYCELTLSFGNNSNDPVVLVSVDLRGTRLAKPLADVHWRVQKWRGR